MVKAPLVIPDVAFGEAFLNGLDAAAFPVSVAMWVKDDEDEWELVLGTPLYDELGAIDAYRRLRQALSEDGSVPLIDYPVRLAGHQNSLIKDLRRKFRGSASVEGMRLGGHTIGGKWIEDGYVYRIR